MSAQMNSRELITVEGRAVERLEYSGVPVVTFKQIDQIHGHKNDDARKLFARNKKHFSEGSDFFAIQNGEARAMGIVAPFGLYLLTESGYLMIAKSFTDDLAWKVQRQLVDNYFRRKSAPAMVPAAPAPMDILKTMFAALEVQQADQAALRQDLEDVKRQLIELKTPPEKVAAPRHGYIKRSTKETHSMDNPLYVRFRQLHKNRTLTWLKERNKIPLTVETLTRVIYRCGKVSPLTLTVICSHLKMTQEELKDAASWLGIEDKMGLFDLYVNK